MSISERRVPTKSALYAKIKQLEEAINSLIKQYELKVSDDTLDIIELTAIAGFLKKLYKIRRDFK